MKIIVYGSTEYGYLIAKEFYQKHDIIVIDKESSNTEEINKLDISFVKGSATDISLLKSLDIKNSDVFIACTNVDESNIVACIMAKRISNIRTICFVANEEYQKSLQILIKDTESCSNISIDSIIWPEELLTKEIFSIVTVEKALDVESFANGRAKLLEYKIDEKSTFAGKKIRECGFPEETLMVGVTRNGELFIPYGETSLQNEDKAIFMGSSNSLDILAAKFFGGKNSGKYITIIGGGNVGLMLAKKLEAIKTKTKIKIIEKNQERCEFLSQNLNNALIIKGNGTDLELLNQEEIGESDVVVSVTNNDEKNLLCSLLVKQLGVKRVVSRVASSLNIPLFEKVGIDIAVSTKFAALHEVKNELSEDKNIDILATVEQGKGEVLEITVPKNFTERKLMELGIPVKVVVGIIHRQNKVIIPKGETLIRVGDELLVFTTNENATKVKEFFKVG